MGQIHQLKEQSPPGTPFEVERATLGFLPIDKHGRVVVKKKRCRKR